MCFCVHVRYACLLIDIDACSCVCVCVCVRSVWRRLLSDEAACFSLCVHRKPLTRRVYHGQ